MTSTQAEDVGIESARSKLGEYANAARYTGQITYLTRNGQRIAAIAPVEVVSAGLTASGQATPRILPWRDAEIRIGTIPQQASLYPKPVILECEDCMTTGFWYPEDNYIDTTRRMCPDEDHGQRPYHRWSVAGWNGNAEVDAPMADDDGDGGTGETQ